MPVRIVDSASICGCVRPEAVTCGSLCRIRAEDRHDGCVGLDGRVRVVLIEVHISVIAQRFTDPPLGEPSGGLPCLRLYPYGMSLLPTRSIGSSSAALLKSHAGMNLAS
jgi:hypothetical protein